MKKLFFLFITLIVITCAVFSACSRENNVDITTPHVSESPADTLAVTATPEIRAEWPTADFITEGMRYTRGGDITAVSYVDGATNPTGVTQWTVYIDGAGVSDVSDYIADLKADGLTYCDISGEQPGKPEPAAVAFEYGFFQWQGERAGGVGESQPRFVIVYLSESPATYGENAQYNMYIMFTDKNMYQ